MRPVLAVGLAGSAIALLLAQDAGEVDDSIARRSLDLEPGGETAWVSAEPNFATGFARATVLNIRVRAGEVVDLGYVQAGRTREFDQPTLVDATFRHDGPAVLPLLRFDVRSLTRGSRTWRTGYAVGRTCQLRLPPDTYDVAVSGSLGLPWLPWIPLAATLVEEVRPVVFSARWNRAARTVVAMPEMSFDLRAEALDYRIDLAPAGAPGRRPGVVPRRPLHGVPAGGSLPRSRRRPLGPRRSSLPRPRRDGDRRRDAGDDVRRRDLRSARAAVTPAVESGRLL